MAKKKSSIEIKATAANFKLVPIEQLVPHPRNTNRHSIEQIEHLAKLLVFQGFREPLTISNRSGFIVAGHCRLEAAKLAGMDKVPCIFQEFDTEAQEFAHLNADNEVARQSELDLHALKVNWMEINKDLPESEQVKLDLLGVTFDESIFKDKVSNTKAPLNQGDYLGEYLDGKTRRFFFVLDEVGFEMVNKLLDEIKDRTDETDEAEILKRAFAHFLATGIEAGFQG